jgi:pyrroline-5-carboxylate reductase
MEEDHINTAMALSSPASVLLFCKSLIDAGVLMGMEQETSLKIASQTIVGVMEVWNKRRVPLDQLLDEAGTPGGIFVESVLTLERHGFQAVIGEAIRNATLKAERLGG